MCQHNEIRDQTGTASNNRIPQFNESYCGYRCGWGCEPPDRADSESDTTRTLINGEDETEGVRRPISPPSGHEGYPALSDGIETGGNNSELSPARSMATRLFSFETSQSSRYCSEPLGNQENVTTSGSRSVATSGSRSVGTVSPGVWVAEAGSWDVYHEADRFPLEYHFLVTPLRLSPQYEHCRGHPDSHMVMEDD
jgi:hypothetical protein